MSMPVSDFSANQNLTLEEFQRFAETHEGMWELYDGVPVRMQSPSPEHQWICHEVMSQFREYFRNRNCIPLQELDVCVSQQGQETRKPDVLVFCNKNQLKGNLVYAPQLVVEIWSPSNFMKERLEKMRTYQQAGIKEFWQIDYTNRDFAVVTLNDSNLASISGGTFQDDIISEYFPDLRVSLAEYDNFLAQIR